MTDDIKLIGDQNYDVFKYDYLMALLTDFNDNQLYPESIKVLDHLTFRWHNGDIELLVNESSYFTIVQYSSKRMDYCDARRDNVHQMLIAAITDLCDHK